MQRQKKKSAAASKKPQKLEREEIEEEDEDEQVPQRVEEDEDEGEQESVPAVAAAPERSKKEPTSDRKKKQTGPKLSDMDLLAIEEREAMRKRIKERLLRMLFVGLVMDFMKEKEQKDQKNHINDKKSKRKGPNSGGKEESQGGGIRGFFAGVNIFGGPFLMVAFTVAIFAARMMEEGYQPSNIGENEENYYEVMGLSNDADVMTVRKAYKALALKWHPDKNPDCEACPTKFAAISKAYETLSNPESKKAYDKGRKKEGGLDSMASVELTAEDFEAKVLRSNEVWYVQVYESTNDFSSSFHPVWEEAALSHQGVAKFGRIDAIRQRKALSFLPQRVVIMPLVFRFARGQAPETFQWSGGGEERSGNAFGRWVNELFPEVQTMDSLSEIKSWWTPTDRPKVLLAGPVGGKRTGAKAIEFMQVQRLAHIWGEMIDMAVSDMRDMRDALGKDKMPEKGYAWSLLVKDRGPDGQVQQRATRDAGDAAMELQDMIARVVKNQAPSLTWRNYQQLCGASGQRRYCLMLVDHAEGPGLAKVLSDLNVSQSNYAQEVAELETSEGDSEEPFQLQPVRVMTSTSRLPWGPSAAGPAFRDIRQAAKWAPCFVFELETGRIAEVKATVITELYQRIAYEDLKFSELPEGLSLVRGLPDPETSLRKDVMSMLLYPPSAVLIFLMLAVVVAVVPELRPSTAAVAFSVVFVLLLICWPWACRRFFTALWCLVLPGRYECQRNL